MLWILEKFKKIDMEVLPLRIYYRNLAKKGIKSAMDRISYERKKREGRKIEFINEMFRLRDEGFISNNAVNIIADYFLGYKFTEIEESEESESIVEALISLISIGGELYPEKVLKVNILISSFMSDKVSDEELFNAFHSFSNLKLKI